MPCVRVHSGRASLQSGHELCPRSQRKPSQHINASTRTAADVVDESGGRLRMWADHRCVELELSSVSTGRGSARVAPTHRRYVRCATALTTKSPLHVAQLGAELLADVPCSPVHPRLTNSARLCFPFSTRLVSFQIARGQQVSASGRALANRTQRLRCAIAQSLVSGRVARARVEGKGCAMTPSFRIWGRTCSGGKQAGCQLLLSLSLHKVRSESRRG